MYTMCAVCVRQEEAWREREREGGGNKRGCQRDSWRRPLKHGGSNGQGGGLGKGGGGGGEACPQPVRLSSL